MSLQQKTQPRNAPPAQREYTQPDGNVTASHAPAPKTARLSRPRTNASLTVLKNAFSAEELQSIVDSLIPIKTGNIPQSKPMASLQMQDIDTQEWLLLETDNLARAFQHRRQLLAGALTAPQLVKLFGIGRSRQTPHDRAKSKTLLAIPDNGVLRFPLWQFDPHGPHGVIDGLPDVLRALAVPPYSQASWLTHPNPDLNGHTPLEVLKSGKIKRVVELARSVGVS